MSKVVQSQPDHFSLQGCVSLASVMQYRVELEQQIPPDHQVEIDLSAVEVDGSAALALLVYLVRRARRNGGDVRFLNMPEKLLHMAQLTGLAELLTLEG